MKRFKDYEGGEITFSNFPTEYYEKKDLEKFYKENPDRKFFRFGGGKGFGGFP